MIYIKGSKEDLLNWVEKIYNAPSENVTKRCCEPIYHEESQSYILGCDFCRTYFADSGFEQIEINI